jgi:hypothetical protein
MGTRKKKKEVVDVKELMKKTDLFELMKDDEPKDQEQRSYK